MHAHPDAFASLPGTCLRLLSLDVAVSLWGMFPCPWGCVSVSVRDVSASQLRHESNILSFLPPFTWEIELKRRLYVRDAFTSWARLIMISRIFMLNTENFPKASDEEFGENYSSYVLCSVKWKETCESSVNHKFIIPPVHPFDTIYTITHNKGSGPVSQTLYKLFIAIIRIIFVLI